MAPQTGLYDVLGVSPTSSQDEIRRAYKNLALQYHPDKNPTGKEKFQEIQHAYEVLNDEERRRRYDRNGDTDGSGPGSDDEDDFISLFDIFMFFHPMGTMWGYCDCRLCYFERILQGSGFRRSRGYSYQNTRRESTASTRCPSPPNFMGRERAPPPPRQSSPPRPEIPPRKEKRRSSDVPITLALTSEEFANGATKAIKVNRNAACKKCQGTGDKQKMRRAYERCKKCGVTGYCWNTSSRAYEACRICDGYGTFLPELPVKRRCAICQGTQVVKETVSLSVTVPSLKKPGDIVILIGQGNRKQDTDSGDVVVTLTSSE